MKIFFSGIGGSGVSAIACFMADRGHEVSGSDRAFDLDPAHPVAKFLKGKNIRILPQNGSGINGSLDLAVMSTAVEEGTPEVVKARSTGVLLKTRPQYLAELAAGFKTIAIAGTSGKSTASGFLAFLMRELGLGPNFIGGGRVKAFKNGGNPGNSLANTDFLNT
nr:Mur ligase domain-containing protein [Nitrospiraceae bacterium]